MKILITNTVILNGGDAAILYATLDILKAAFGEDVDIVVYDSQPKVVKRYYRDIEVRKLLYFKILENLPKIKGIRFFYWSKLIPFRIGMWFWRKGFHNIAKKIFSKELSVDISNYQSADIIISTGGTYLVENYSLSPRILDYEFSLLMNKPLFFFTQSMGPFHSKRNRRKLLDIFQRSALIFLRDGKSLGNVLNIGVPKEKCHVLPDVVFAYEALKHLAPGQIHSKKDDEFKVAISVRNWPHFKSKSNAEGMDDYIHSLRQLTKWLVEKYDAKIIFVSTCQGIKEYLNDDSKIARRIVEPIESEIKKNIELNADFHNPAQLSQLLSECDFVVSTRMHMAILSLLQKVPVLPISYEFKIEELFHKLELGQWVEDIEKVKSESLLRKTEQFIQSLEMIRLNMSNQLPILKNEAEKASLLTKTAYELCKAADKDRGEK